MRIKKTISPTKAAILVCASIATVVLLIPQTEAFSVNFVYQDLLAHPQYDVEFLKEVVPASSVTRPNTHRRQVTKLTKSKSSYCLHSRLYIRTDRPYEFTLALEIATTGTSAD